MACSVPRLSLDPFATTNEALQAPSARHPMGTDDLGRDILSQLLWGSRVSLVRRIRGRCAGDRRWASSWAAVAGYRGGWLDDLLMRVTEVFMILPRLLLAVVAVALIGAGMWNTILVIGGLAWPGMARLVRAEVLSLRSRDFVEAARSLGQPQWRIIAREILPNALPLVIVNASLEIGAAIILEAGLSFLGLGDPNRMSWGTILNNAQRFLEDAWWMSVFPGTAIFLTVLGFNFAGDALNDVLDPQHGRRLSRRATLPDEKEIGMRLTPRWMIGAVVVLAMIAAALFQATAASRTFIIASSANPTTLNPVLTTEFPAHFTSAMIFNSLVTTTLDLRTEPDLAESWTISPDGLTYTFKLRDGVKWHDGKPFRPRTSSSPPRSCGRSTRRTGPPSSPTSTSVSVTDPRTVAFKLKTKFAPLMTYLGTPYFSPILPKHLYEGTDVVKNDYNAKPVGTGPFVFEEWRRGQHIKLKKNAAYFKKGLPLLDSAVVQIMPDEPSRLRALEKGEIDMAVLIPNHVVPKWQRSNEIGVTSETWKSFASLGWIFVNMRSPVVGGLDDKGRKVRQALYHTLDRKAVVEKVYFGAGKVAAGPINSGHDVRLQAGPAVVRVRPRAGGEAARRSGLSAQGGRGALQAQHADHGEPGRVQQGARAVA